MGKDKPATPVTAAEVEELPRTIVRRVVKDKLSEISGDGGDVILHKEALIAFSESARIFIHYISATAHDICNESKRQIINADDVLNALDEIEFSEFVDPLKEALDEFRKKAAGKRAGVAKAKDISKKRKTDLSSTGEKGGDEGEGNNADNSNDVENEVNGDHDDEAQASGDSADEVEEQAIGVNEDEEQASGDNEDEEQASGDNEDEEQASGDNEDEEQASGDNEDEEQASGDNEDEEQASGNNEDEEQASGDNEDEVEEQVSGAEEDEDEEQGSED
ncbi:hypothetical protein vseg_004146 [Gypsophila vaccaria]